MPVLVGAALVLVASLATKKAPIQPATRPNSKPSNRPTQTIRCRRIGEGRNACIPLGEAGQL